jgi:hypothetical protein
MVLGILILAVLLPIALLPLALKTYVPDNELDEMGVRLTRQQSMIGSEVPIRLAVFLNTSANHS